MKSPTGDVGYGELAGESFCILSVLSVCKVGQNLSPQQKKKNSPFKI